MGTEGDGKRAPAVPDLMLPAPRKSGANVPAVSKGASKHPPRVDLDPSFDAFGEMELERSAVSSPPARSAPPLGSGRPTMEIEISHLPEPDDLDDMQIERGGAIMSGPPTAMSRAPASAPTPSRAPAASARPSGSGLDVAYRRMDPRRAIAHDGPSVLEHVLAWAFAFVPFGGAVAALLRYMHRHGRTVTGLLPHAFDATSSVQSGGVAIGALIVGTMLGVLGLKVRPRSYAMLASAGLLLLIAIAMVTVALVATEENPTPADGALLVPYAVPLGVLLFGFALARRGVALFLDGGLRRGVAVLAGATGGAIAFAAFEWSMLAAFV